MPRLIVSLPDEPEVTHELTEEVISIGRISENTIQIEHASVSSHHAELMLQGEQYILRDIGSTNGTQVNGSPAEPEQQIPLNPGDQIFFGHIVVQYVTDSGGEVAQPLPMEAVVAPASESVPPSNFTNASPFQTKSDKKDPALMAMLALGGLAILAAGYAIFSVLQMQAPA